MKITVKHTNLVPLMRKLDKINELFKESRGELSYDIISTHFEDVTFGNNFNPVNGYTWTTVKVLVDEIEIYGNLQNSDWKVVALALRQKDNTVVVNSIDNSVEIPVEFYGSEIRCDHCHTNRRRDQGVIIYNKVTDEFKMVGTACLKEFTGLSFEALESLFGLKTTETEKTERLSSKNFTLDKYIYNVEELLCVSCSMYDKFIESDKSSPVYQEIPYKKNYSLKGTALFSPYLIYAIHCPTGEVGVNKTNYLKGKSYSRFLGNDPATYKEKVASMLEWFNGLDIQSVDLKTFNFGSPMAEQTFRNLKVYAKQEDLKFEGAQKLVSLITLYEYHVIDEELRQKETLERLARLQRGFEDKRFIPTEGDKIESKINKLTFSDLKYGAYGSYIVVNAFCNDGNKYTCFVKPYDKEDFKENLILTGTVKSKAVWKGSTSYVLKGFKLLVA